MQHPFPIGTQVAFNIEDLVLGTAVVATSEYDDGWLYQLMSVAIMRGDTETLRQLATESDDGVWACEHELQVHLPGHATAGRAA
ncbi:MAG: hypothetical protein ACK5Q5_07220 [Planctomycetaceae bacterium]